MISANCERQMKSQQEFRQHLRMRCRDQVSEAIWDCFEAPVGRRAPVRVKINWKHRGNERFALYSSCLELFKLASVSLRLSAGRAQDAKAKTLEIVNVKVLAGLRKMKVGCNVFFGCHNPHRKKAPILSNTLHISGSRKYGDSSTTQKKKGGASATQRKAAFPSPGAAVLLRCGWCCLPVHLVGGAAGGAAGSLHLLGGAAFPSLLLLTGAVLSPCFVEVVLPSSPSTGRCSCFPLLLRGIAAFITSLWVVQNVLY